MKMKFLFSLAALVAFMAVPVVAQHGGHGGGAVGPCLAGLRASVRRGPGLLCRSGFLCGAAAGDGMTGLDFDQLLDVDRGAGGRL